MIEGFKNKILIVVALIDVCGFEVRTKKIFFYLLL